jgi:hypothetical protein
LRWICRRGEVGDEEEKKLIRTEFEVEVEAEIEIECEINLSVLARRRSLF